MKQTFTIPLFFCLFAISIASGQGGNTKRLIASNYVQWDIGDNSIVWGDSMTYTYNGEGQPMETVELAWESGAWTKYSRWYQREYDADNRLWRYIQQKPDIGNQWVDDTRFVFSYDGQGNRVNDLQESWISGEWEYLLEVKRTFDAQGNLLVHETPTTKWHYNYDQQGLNTSILCQSFVNGVWEDRWLNTLVYTAASMGLPAENSVQRWSGTGWENHERNLFTYTGSGQEETRVYQVWGNNTWENHNKQTRMYNFNQEINQVLIQEWSGGGWENDSQVTYQYDLPGLVSTVMTHIWQNGNWVQDGFGRFYYTEISSVQTPGASGFQTFPNPANSSVTLKGGGLLQVKIFDLEGRLLYILHPPGQDEETIFLESLPAGNYILQVLDSSGKTGAKPLQIRR